MTQPPPIKRTTRDEIVRAAMEMFAAHGYRGASLDRIAAEVGVTRQALLHHFPSKVTLLLAVLEARDREDTERFTRLAEKHAWSLRDALAAVLRHYVAHPELARLYTVLAAEAVEPDHPAHAWFVDRYRRVRAQLTEALAAEQTGSRLESAVPPEVVAGALVALLDGLQLQALLEPGAVDNEQALATLLPLVTGGATDHPLRVMGGRAQA
jgi:AcrR family transcriptional regulator